MLTLEGMQLGNYDVVRRIRVGGMGAVYEGRQRSAFGRRVAIKVILGSYASDREMRRRFAREARTIAQLHHPHILPLIEFGDEQGILYLVMPFIEGGTLTGYLRRTLPEISDVAAIFSQLLDAVEYAHDEGLIHRDIKSSNVLLEARRDGQPYVYLADFGLVRYSEQLDREQTGKPIPLDQIPGTPHYMAPEQTRGIVTTATDIYALGVLLYQLLVGELPYDDSEEVEVVKMHLYAPIPSPCDRDASIPIELGEVVRKAMAKRAEDRFGSVAEMRQAFLAAIEGPVPYISDKSELLEIDELLAKAPPVWGNSEPLAQSKADEPASQWRSKRHHMTAHFPPHVNRSMKRNVRQNHRLFTLSVVAATLVPLMLLILLLMPRVSGFSFFPTGFPVFGTAPYATISVTVQSKTLQNTYLMTASPQVSTTNFTKRIIPDHAVSGAATDSQTIAASGINTIAGTQASGSILFVNTSQSASSVPLGNVFTTMAGVEVKLTQAVLVPPHNDGQDGTASASGVAVLAGRTGNIPANSLNTVCCDNTLKVSNPQPFTGGVDTQVVHYVTQADIDSVSNALMTQLEKQALQHLQKQFAPNEIEVGQVTYTTKVEPDSATGTQTNEVRVQVSVLAKTYVFNQTIARLVAAQLLNKQAEIQLNNHYLLQGVPTIGKPVVVQQGQDGIIYLSVLARGVWIHSVSTQQIKQWQQSIKGATPMLARTYLDTQPGVADVTIQLPFGTDHLPASVDQIRIVLVNG